MNLIEKLIGRKPAKPVSETASSDAIPPETPSPYLIQEGAQYEIVRIEKTKTGNKVVTAPVDRPQDAALETETDCPACGAKYPGPVGQACEYCNGSYRQVFLRKLESVKDPDSLQKQPKSDNQSLHAPSGVQITPEGYIIGQDAEVSRVVSKKIVAGPGLQCGLLVGQDITIGVDAEIDRVIIENNGRGLFDHDTHIHRLIAGEDVTLVFGNDCTVESIWAVSLKALKTGSDFYLGSQESISFIRFVEIRNEKLR